MSDDCLVRLNLWAAALGWPELRSVRRVLEDFRGRSLTVMSYEAGEASGRRDHVALHINEHPIGQATIYAAAVYAVRYRICSGWHVFCLKADDVSLQAEGERLACWLDRSWFESADRRRKYRRMHPECVGFTWTRLREKGPPYVPEVGDRG